MRISVILPVWRETDLLDQALRRLAGRPELEIITATAGEPGSAATRASLSPAPDSTAARNFRAGARVVMTDGPCRGSQLDAGARIATAPILLFLHADCRLPDGFERAIEAALADPVVVLGAFSLAYDASGGWFRLIEAATRWRIALTGTPYGDQAFFMRREDYLACGGFRPWPLLEDVDLVRRLRMRGRIRILPERVTASVRRYLTDGRVRTTLRYRLAALLWTFHLPAPWIWRIVGTGSRPQS